MEAFSKGKENKQKYPFFMYKNVNFFTFVRFWTWPIDGFCTFASHFIYSVHRKWRSVVAYIQRVSEMAHLLFQIWHIKSI